MAVRYRRLGSMKMTGSSPRMAEASRPLVSAGVDGLLAVVTATGKTIPAACASVYQTLDGWRTSLPFVIEVSMTTGIKWSAGGTGVCQSTTVNIWACRHLGFFPT